MDVSGGHGIALDRLVCTDVDLNVAFSYRFQCSPGIQGCLVERRIAVYGADSEEFDARVVTCEEESVRVLTIFG